MKNKSRHKALFLDRDGIVNLDKGYVHKIEDFIFVEGIFEVCKLFRDLDFLLVVVSNQSGLGRGIFSENDLNRVDNWMKEQFLKRGLLIQRAYYCPYVPGGKPEYAVFELDRKPEPGMFFKARDELEIKLAESVLIGDKPSDIQAGKAAGIGKCIYLKSRYSDVVKEADYNIAGLTDLLSLSWIKQLKTDKK